MASHVLRTTPWLSGQTKDRTLISPESTESWSCKGGLHCHSSRLRHAETVDPPHQGYGLEPNSPQIRKQSLLAAGLNGVVAGGMCFKKFPALCLQLHDGANSEGIIAGA